MGGLGRPAWGADCSEQTAGWRRACLTASSVASQPDVQFVSAYGWKLGFREVAKGLLDGGV